MKRAKTLASRKLEAAAACKPAPREKPSKRKAVAGGNDPPASGTMTRYLKK